MSWLKRYSIHCSNKRCFASVICPPRCTTLGQALRHARSEGWRREGENDLCPAHARQCAAVQAAEASCPDTVWIDIPSEALKLDT